MTREAVNGLDHQCTLGKSEKINFEKGIGVVFYLYWTQYDLETFVFHFSGLHLSAVAEL
jgi:hypothetical protein